MAIEKLKTKIRREQILQAVLGLIAAKGVKALSVGAVARRVGLVPSALYRHFKNKDEMLDAAIDLFEERITSNYKSVLMETPDCIERLRLLLMRQIRMIRENQIIALPRIVFSEDLYGKHPYRKTRFYRVLQGHMRNLADLILEGQKRRQIRSQLDPATVSRLFLALIQSAGILWFLSDGDFDITKHAEKSWEIFRKAIQA